MRRLGVDLSMSNTVTIASIQGILRLGRVYKEGYTVNENMHGVPYPTHQQIINGIDIEKARE